MISTPFKIAVLIAGNKEPYITNNIEPIIFVTLIIIDHFLLNVLQLIEIIIKIIAAIPNISTQFITTPIYNMITYSYHAKGKYFQMF